MVQNSSHPFGTFRALRSGDLVLYPIEESNLAQLEDRINSVDEHEYFLKELHRSYLPRYDDERRRTKYGFYAELDGVLAGMSLLGISSWEHRRGYTGADTFPHMRGRDVAPRSKPLLFYLAFELLQLNRVETGCLRSNDASRRSIEKTKGFVFEGTLREYNRVGEGRYEDDLRWAILRRDWLELYDKSEVGVIL